MLWVRGVSYEKCRISKLLILAVTVRLLMIQSSSLLMHRKSQLLNSYRIRRGFA